MRPLETLPNDSNVRSCVAMNTPTPVIINPSANMSSHTSSSFTTVN